MMKTTTHKILIAMALLFFTGAMNARDIYFDEDFSDGAIPAGWTTDDASGQNALWTYCADPNSGQVNGCPRLWDDALNLQGPFAATTATNGFMTLDSDAYGNLPTNHFSQLTTPVIDLTGTTAVYIEFNGHIGAFTVDPNVGALLQVSSDGGSSWTDLVPYPTLVAGPPAPPDVRWSFNPSMTSIDISSLVAGQANVLLRWQWEGNFEYHWNLDDVVLTNLPDLIFADGLDTTPP